MLNKLCKYSLRSVLGALGRDCFLIGYSDVKIVVIICPHLLVWTHDSKRFIHAASEIFLELVFNERAAFPFGLEVALSTHIVGLHLATLVIGETRSIIGGNFFNLDIILVWRWTSVTASILSSQEVRLITAAMVSYLIFLFGICCPNRISIIVRVRLVLNRIFGKCSFPQVSKVAQRRFVIVQWRLVHTFLRSPNIRHTFSVLIIDLVLVTDKILAAHLLLWIASVFEKDRTMWLILRRSFVVLPVQEHQRQKWHEVIVDELERKHRLEEGIRHWMRVISREVNPEVECEYNDEAAS